MVGAIFITTIAGFPKYVLYTCLKMSFHNFRFILVRPLYIARCMSGFLYPKIKILMQ